MRKNNRMILVGLSALIVSSTTIAQNAGNTMDAFLNAPAWYVQFEVTFKASTKGIQKYSDYSSNYAISLDRTFSAMWPLDMRNQGPSTVLSASFLSGTADGTTPSYAEQMKFAQDMMARMENAANWMSTGGALSIDENASQEEQQAASEANMKAAMGPAKVDYLRVDVVDSVYDEQGGLFKQTTRTTRKGEGMVLPGSGMTITFEIDAAAKKYALVLPFEFGDMDSKLTMETTTTMEAAGQQPTETKQSNEFSLGSFPVNIIIDDPKNVQAAMAIVHGDINTAAGKISEVRSIAAHYMEGEISVPGTLTLKYTLTTTTPPKPAATKK